MVPGGEKGDVHLQANMGPRSQMIPEKCRELGLGNEAMMKLHPGRSDMLPSQQKMVTCNLLSTLSRGIAWAQASLSHV
jgi:hypothetical protein